MRKIFHSCLFLLVVALPAPAAASVLITEIMYDLEGADGGYEWVEITNTGDMPVNVGEWRLFEQGVNHKLVLFKGASSVLQPGVSAVVADKPNNLVARYPALELVFDSAFSLSNEGETLMLKDGGGKTVDQVTYRSSLGAQGDGGSLHLEGEILVPGLPNPGVYPGEVLPVPQKQQEKQQKNSYIAPGSAYAAAGAAPTGNTATLWPWILGLLSVMGLGIAGVWLVKTEKVEETSSLADEFEIIDNSQKTL